MNPDTRPVWCWIGLVAVGIALILAAAVTAGRNNRRF